MHYSNSIPALERFLLLHLASQLMLALLPRRCLLASEAPFENCTFMMPRQSPSTTSTFLVCLSLRRPSPPHTVRRRSNHRRKKRTPIKPNWPKRRARGRKRRLAYVSGRDGIEVDNEREGGTCRKLNQERHTLGTDLRSMTSEH